MDTGSKGLRQAQIRTQTQGWGAARCFMAGLLGLAWSPPSGFAVALY